MKRVDALGVSHSACDITDRDAVFTLVKKHRPDIILNCAAYTKVDDAEQNENLATRINGEAVACLGEAAKTVDAYFLTFSTDYVFEGEGDTPYLEDDPVGPACAYGRSKLVGEKRLEELGGRWAILRTQWLYGAGGKNFIDTISDLARGKESLKVVEDQVGAPTWVEDLSEIIVNLMEAGAEGIYHAANSKYASWYEVATYIVSQFGLRCSIHPCSSDEFPRPAKRPHNSRLNLDKITNLLGHRPRPWQEALKEYLLSK